MAAIVAGSLFVTGTVHAGDPGDVDFDLIENFCDGDEAVYVVQFTNNSGASGTASIRPYVEGVPRPDLDVSDTVDDGTSVNLEFHIDSDVAVKFEVRFNGSMIGQIAYLGGRSDACAGFTEDPVFVTFDFSCNGDSPVARMVVINGSLNVLYDLDVVLQVGDESHEFATGDLFAGNSTDFPDIAVPSSGSFVMEWAVLPAGSDESLFKDDAEFGPLDLDCAGDGESGAGLPDSGADSGTLALLAAGLLAIGLGLAGATRMRRRSA